MEMQIYFYEENKQEEDIINEEEYENYTIEINDLRRNSI
jgi:hypothetical protein